jgi:glycosyltransferase involved in cell wall biosynthesis
MKVIVVIPAFNEGSVIGEVVDRVRSVNLPGMTKDVIVVDDGSSDGTGAKAKSRGVRVIRHLLNRGLGAALGTGLEAALRAGADIVVTFDADEQHSVDDIPKVIRPIRERRADVVIGSRLLEASGMPWTRKVANHLANWVTSVLSGLKTTDSQSGLRAFSRDAAVRIRIKSNRYEVSSEIITEIQRNGLRMEEVPIRTIYTPYSMSKGQGFRVGLRTLFKLLLSRRLR